MYKWWLMIDLIHKHSKNYNLHLKHKNGVNKFLDNILSGHEESYQKLTKIEKTDEDKKNFLDQIYSIRDQMTYEEIREVTFTVLAGGFDTSGKNISGVLLLLAMNQEIQEKLVGELKQILISDDDDIDNECLAKMTF
jgi:cytochrome P450